MWPFPLLEHKAQTLLRGHSLLWKRYLELLFVRKVFRLETENEATMGEQIFLNVFLESYGLWGYSCIVLLTSLGGVAETKVLQQWKSNTLCFHVVSTAMPDALCLVSRHAVPHICYPSVLLCCCSRRLLRSECAERLQAQAKQRPQWSSPAPRADDDPDDCLCEAWGKLKSLKPFFAAGPQRSTTWLPKMKLWLTTWRMNNFQTKVDSYRVKSRLGCKLWS